ncbi:MAG: hypothetical protein ABH817_01925 [archaeon]
MPSLQNLKNKKAQITLFIIIAVIIIAGVVLTLVLTGPGTQTGSPDHLVSIYMQDCIDEAVKQGVQIASLQGGYLELPVFDPGSTYRPFSNYLHFIGMQVPYWFYISGNNLQKIQKPELSLIETQFENYVEEEILNCDLNQFYAQGLTVYSTDLPQASVSIKGNYIETNVLYPLTVVDESSIVLRNHVARTETKFKQLYDDASKLFEYEQESLFLETYSIDVLRLYAPVTGFEFSCAPKVWIEEQVEQELFSALSANIGALKIKGNSFSLGKTENKYFIVDPKTNIDSQVSFLTTAVLSHRFEVLPKPMKADPIGNQLGLELIGFCYVPYHFVYDVYYPVVVQLMRGNEIFQFPMLIVIDKNVAREAKEYERVPLEFDICKERVQGVTIYTFDSSSNPVETEISYKCFDQVCDVGETSISGGLAQINTKIPACLNGQLIARADGYANKKLIVSSNEQFVANLFMDREYSLDLDLDLTPEDYAIVRFESSDYQASAFYPLQTKINLIAGTYSITVQLFKKATINLEAQSGETCINIPDPILGVREQCFDLEVPSQTLTNVIFGGGIGEITVDESGLSSARKIEIKADRFDLPKNLEDLAEVYVSVETGEVTVRLI